MKTSLNWISDYVNLEDIDVDWLVNKFTITTAERTCFHVMHQYFHF